MLSHVNFAVAIKQALDLDRRICLRVLIITLFLVQSFNKMIQAIKVIRFSLRQRL